MHLSSSLRLFAILRWLPDPKWLDRRFYRQNKPKTRCQRFWFLLVLLGGRGREDFQVFLGGLESQLSTIPRAFEGSQTASLKENVYFFRIQVELPFIFAPRRKWKSCGSLVSISDSSAQPAKKWWRYISTCGTVILMMYSFDFSAGCSRPFQSRRMRSVAQRKSRTELWFTSAERSDNRNEMAFWMTFQSAVERKIDYK